jgi:uroporphyrinogen-III decarboxylase
MFTVPSNTEKQAVWDAFAAGKPLRVPLQWGTNSRIVVLDPDLNPEGYSYEQMFTDPQVPLIMQSRFQEYCHTTLADTNDTLCDLPAAWNFYAECMNTYDGGYFGGAVHFHDGQLPTVEPFMSIDEVDDFLRRDFSRPLENPWLQRVLRFREEMVAAARDFRYAGRAGVVAPLTLGFDGPLTISAMLFGADIYLLMATDPPKARELLLCLTRAAIQRYHALQELAGLPKKAAWGGSIADDAIQLISTAMYEEIVLPAHELWYNETSETTLTSRNRGLHLCGDATRHFPFLVERLGIVMFDTGFPVDHGALRRQLGPDIHINGGPPVGLLCGGTPDECFAETRRILQSGIKEGGKFTLREGNNLPPRVPFANLQAVYAACLEYGWYAPQP